MRNRFVPLLDVPLIALSVLGAFVLRFDWLFFSDRREFVPFLVAAILVKPLVFSVFGLYRRYWAYATVRDLVAIAAAVSSASAVLAVGITVAVSTRSLAQFSRSVILIDLLLTLVLVGGLRFCVRWLSEHRGRRRGLQSGPRRSVPIVGAGDAGTAVLRELERNDHLGLEPIGMLDDDPIKQGKRIYGVRVLGRVEDLARTIEAYSIQEVIIAMPGAPARRSALSPRSVPAPAFRRARCPGVFELLDGGVSVSRLREVDIADLLRRAQIDGAPEARLYLHGRPVVWSPARAGRSGCELCRQVAHARPAPRWCCSATARTASSTPNAAARGASRVRRFTPSSPTSATRDAPAPASSSGRPARRVPRRRAQARAADGGATRRRRSPTTSSARATSSTRRVAVGVERFVLISTDKAVAPTSVMGATKRVAEMHRARRARARIGRAFVVVRFGNVLGSRGSVVPIFKRQIERGGPVTVTHPDMTRFFMTIPEAVHLVLQAGGLAHAAASCSC